MLNCLPLPAQISGMNLEQLADNIEQREDGIYYAKTESAISYPESGNDDYMIIEEDSFWFKHRNNLIVEAVNKYSPDAAFFDIGGGNGYVAKGLMEAGKDVVLVEPGKSGAKNAVKRNIPAVVCATLQDAGFKKESIDSVGMFDVVEHIEDDVKFLKDTYQYMKPESKIYITVPAFNSLWSNEDTEVGHYKRYTKKSMGTVLEQAGFQMVYSSYIFSILPIPVFLFRALPSRLGFNNNPTDLKKNQNEHKMRPGIISNSLQKIWNWELGKVKKGESIGVGGSCFVVAQKG